MFRGGKDRTDAWTELKGCLSDLDSYSDRVLIEAVAGLILEEVHRQHDSEGDASMGLLLCTLGLCQGYRGRFALRLRDITSWATGLQSRHGAILCGLSQLSSTGFVSRLSTLSISEQTHRKRKLSDADTFQGS